MNFDLTDEQKIFADQVRRFAQTHLAAGALKRAHDPRFPYEVAQLMAKQGMMGIRKPMPPISPARKPNGAPSSSRPAQADMKRTLHTVYFMSVKHDIVSYFGPRNPFARAARYPCRENRTLKL
jgi:hypothetical protein